MLFFGLKVSLIGMGTVFFALILLVFVIRAISLAAQMLDRRTSPVPAGSAAGPAAPILLIRQADAEELAAVISVAVAAYRGDRE